MAEIFIGILLLFLGGFIMPLFKNKYKISVLAFVNLIAAFLCVKPSISVLFTDTAFNAILNFNEIFGRVNFQLDKLSAFFVVIISVMSTITTVYAKGYLQPYIDKGKNINAHLIFFQTLVASMLAVVTCQNAFMFLICWEIMSLSSFFLVIFENEKKDVLKAGIKYLVFMHISVIFIMAAFAVLATKSGSFDFSSFVNVLHSNRHLADLIFIMFFVGFGTKAGFVPFHNWLPDAHPAAPSHVSALMSGVMIKTGIYGILRILLLGGAPDKYLAFTLLIISVITALYGVLYAVTQNDIKKLLAYSSIENIGIIGIGLGMGMIGLAYNHPITAILGFTGGILHVLNHSVFKELLFFAAGSVYVKAHTRDMEVLGGVIKSMPKTSVLFLIGSVAICGLPPFNGFVSEFLIYIGMFKGLLINNFFAFVMILFTIAALALVGTMAILCFTKAFSVIFLGNPRSSVKITQDNSASMTFPMGILAVLALSVGVFPLIGFVFAFNPASLFVNVSNFDVFSSLTLIGVITLFAFGFLVFTSLLILIRKKLSNGKIEFSETWGCGYNKPNNKMQYTASSYVSPFLSMLKPLFKKVFDIEKPKRLFPHDSHFNLKIEDIEEAYIIKPLVKYDEWFLSRFEAIQSGNIQSYIKYGLIFLVIVIIGSLLI